PYIGAAFRYRTQMKQKTELLVIMTPHVVRSRMDADQILADEARKISWHLPEVVKMHGPSGMEPVIGPPPGGGHVADVFGLPTEPLPGLPIGPTTPPNAKPAAPESKQEVLPKPKPLPPAGSVHGTIYQEVPASGAPGQPAATQVSAEEMGTAPPQPQKEDRV